MEDWSIHLITTALQTALLLALPLIAATALIGVVMGIVQTVVQIQDQNVAFLPKLASIALIIFAAGTPALMALVLLFRTAAETALHAIAR